MKERLIATQYAMHLSMLPDDQEEHEQLMWREHGIGVAVGVRWATRDGLRSRRG